MKRSFGWQARDIHDLQHAFARAIDAGLHEEVAGRRFMALLPDPRHQDVIEMSADRRAASARYHCLMQVEGQGPHQWWQSGVFENTYVKVADTWELEHLAYRATSAPVALRC